MRAISRRVGLLFLPIALAIQTGLPSGGGAEWYVAGYGGTSVGSSLSNVSMPVLGEQRARALFPNVNPQPGDFLNQQLTGSDVSLKNSPMFGAKVGYFFNRFNFPWLGLELESFTTEPNIKTQTITTTQRINSFRQGVPYNEFTPTTTTIQSSYTFSEARIRLVTTALNVIVRYPGRYVQPYGGVGVGVFTFIRQAPQTFIDVTAGLNALAGIKILLTEHLVLFAEGKYVRTSVNSLDKQTGLTGDFSQIGVVGGIGFHF